MVFVSFFVFMSFMFSTSTIHVFGSDRQILTSDFFFSIQKHSWDSFDLKQKEKQFNSFLKNELFWYEASVLGLDLRPTSYLKLLERKKHLLVNSYYERVVALPLVDSLSLSFLNDNVGREVFTYHILFGFDGCALSGSFPLSQKEAYKKALSFSFDLQNTFNSCSVFNDRVLLFQKQALLDSEDPSVNENSGSLGWVSLGRSVEPFQSSLFNTPVGEVSSPILTPYGYHLIFIEKERPSNFSYYDASLQKDMSNKLALQALSFDSLKSAASRHDSLLLSAGFLVFNRGALFNK